MIFAGPVRVCAIKPVANWSKFNFFSVMFRSKRQNAISDASNGSATP